MEPLNGAEPTRRCHVIATPYPGRGHVNPMMNLCKLLVSRNDGIMITFVVTEEWHGFIASQPKPENIRFGCIPNVIPSEHGRADDFPAFIEAVRTKMEEPYERLLDRLDQPPTVIVADTYLSWAVRVGNRRNIPVASLWPMSATALSLLYHFDLLRLNRHFPADFSENGEERVDYIPGISSIRTADLPAIFPGDGEKVLDTALSAIHLLPKTQYLLFTSAQELEPQVLNALRSKFNIPLYPIGPVIPFFNPQNPSPRDPQARIFQWLDSQPPNSVLYVSLGSFLSVPEAQMEEIAAGLRDSGVRFLWVTRSENRVGVGGDERRGLAVAWCDQLRVLSHGSVGGFWTHCGWNSCLEGAYSGVPMLTFPIIWDQSPNSKIVVEDWGVGVRARTAAMGVGASAARSKTVGREEIAGRVRRFMDLESEEGKEMRKRARGIRELCLTAVHEGGSSEANVNAFTKDITRGL